MANVLFVEGQNSGTNCLHTPTRHREADQDDESWGLELNTRTAVGGFL